MTRVKQGLANYLMLFSSASTLLCCALPTLLVSLGLGAVMAGLASNVPGLIWISENKPLVFSVAGILLFFNGLLMWLNRNAPCPIDPVLRDTCIRGRKTGRILYVVSVSMYLTGLFFAFFATA